ncbi:hypothetical protein O3M35_000935 [Rhynocoris fuscipes]|uniref:Beta-1,4-glucuronyltransferase 1 n=1 Tax=Rhynocoris fuscipes TaxID=488301 RepID=A0AAW1DNG6_9HEMI
MMIIVGSCTKLILLLTAVVAILQIIHLVLLNHLDSLRFQNKVLIGTKESSVSPELEIRSLFSQLQSTLKNKHILDSTGVFRIANVERLSSKRTTYSVPTPDLTLVTQCSFDHIFKLVPLSKRWQGAISVAVFAEEKDIYDALWKIAHLLSCYQVFKENITFSIVSPVPSQSITPSTIPNIVGDETCNFQKEEHVQNYAFTQRYPNNLLRNVARRASYSEFVMVIDIDIMPSENLRQDFLLFATQKGLFKKNHVYDKTAFVVPAFEAKDNVEPPLHKAQLISLVETGEIRPFYSQICPKCQALTNYEAWLNEPIGAELAPIYDVIWKDPWEPFYIVRNNAPLYDERFKQYGFNRISQVCELHVAGYTFFILNNAFLIHKGFKTLDSFHEDIEKDQNNNRHLFRQFKAELKFKYIDSSRRCY